MILLPVLPLPVLVPRRARVATRSSVMNEVVQTIELSDEEVTSSSPELAVDSLVLIRNFLAWQLEDSSFEFGLIVPSGGIVKSLLGNQSDDLPKIFLSDYLLANANDEMAKLCRRGFSVVFSSMNTENEITEFFKKSHFSISGDSTSNLEKSPVCEGAWNKSQLLLTLKIACALGGKTLCCFAHDADLIYVMNRPGFAGGSNS